MNATRLSITTVLAASVMLGCATQPLQSELVGVRWFKTNIDTYPVRIDSVDGRSSTMVPLRVDAGPRRLVLSSIPGGAGFSDQIVFNLDVRPCTRYYIVAQKDNRLAAGFTPKVDYAEPLAGCRSPGA